MRTHRTHGTHTFVKRLEKGCTTDDHEERARGLYTRTHVLCVPCVPVRPPMSAICVAGWCTCEKSGEHFQSRHPQSKRGVNPLAPARATLLWVPETLFHCARVCLGVLRNRQAQSHSADDRSAWMLENPAFQFSRFPEVAVTGELHVQTAACTAAELPIGNFSVGSLAPSRINRPGRIPVQTAAEE